MTPAYELDGAIVPPAQFYAVACDPARSVVVEACAGAGKTWMLVGRILRALLDGADPAQILAITFTRKAAGEMRARLDSLLQELTAASPAQRMQALVQRGLAPAAAQALAPRLDGLYERVLATGQGVQVHTFHSWFAQLMRAAPIELLARLGLAPGAELVDEPDDLLPAAWRALLERAQREPTLLQDLGAQVRLRGQFRVRAWLESAVAKRVEIELADRAGTLEASMPGVVEEGGPHPLQALDSAPWQATLRDLAAELGTARGKLARDAGARLADALVLVDVQPRFDALRRALFTMQGAPRRLGDSPSLRAAQSGLEDLAAQVAQHEAQAEHLRMVRLSRAMLQAYAAVKRQRGLADMADLEQVALELLRDGPLAAWVHERLDLRVRHLLIDEFQDTSPLQWQALHAWLSGYAGAGGGASGQQPPGLFIVGDPKQSIYRFRRAEPRVFGAATQFVREALGGHVLACDHTRRNAQGVLDLVNASFEALQADQRFAGFRRHTTQAGEPGEVRALPPVPRPARGAAGGGTAEGAAEGEADEVAGLWRDSLVTPRVAVEERLRDVEARQVGDAIAALVAQGVPPGEIHVLSRRRALLLPVAQALAQRGIAHASPEPLPLQDSWVARDLLALLDVLASTHHDLSLAQVLRSPVFRAGDAELTQLALQARAGGTSWWHALVGPRAGLAVGEGVDDGAGSAIPALQRARDSLLRWRGWAAALPPHDLLQRIVADGDLRARFAAAVPPPQAGGVLDQLEGVLAQALWLGGARYATPYNFVRAMRRLSIALPARPHEEAVQLLTVHGAKGLEAEVVFIVDAAAARSRPDQDSLLVEWPVEAAAPLRCAFIASEARCPPALQAALEAENQARAREELNALYVAMTRARRLLVFSHVEPRGRDDDASWWQLVQPHGLVPWQPAPAVTARSAEEPLVLRELPAVGLGEGRPQVDRPAGDGAARRAAVPAGAAGEAAADATTAALGTAVHRALEWLTRQPAAGRTAAAVQHAARQATLQAGLPAEAAARVQPIVQAILGSPVLAPLLDPQQLDWAGNEVVVGWQGEALRIDRLVAQRSPAGHRRWWVLDYKLQHAPHDLESYRDQLARYRDAVRAGRPGDEVRAAFVTGGGALIELPGG
jgi:ATP-dependent helicase/nuclease subunit A